MSSVSTSLLETSWYSNKFDFGQEFGISGVRLFTFVKCVHQFLWCCVQLIFRKSDFISIALHVKRKKRRKNSMDNLLMITNGNRLNQAAITKFLHDGSLNTLSRGAHFNSPFLWTVPSNNKSTWKGIIHLSIELNLYEFTGILCTPRGMLRITRENHGEE